MEGVRIGVAGASRKALIGQLGVAAQAALALDSEEVAGALAARERLGSTGFGGGVAIPHAKLPGLSRIGGLLIRAAQPVDWGAVDEQPVDLIFTLLSPVGAGADHLKALAQVSRRLRDDGLVAKLRGAGSPDAIWALWTAEEARDAA